MRREVPGPAPALVVGARLGATLVAALVAGCFFDVGGHSLDGDGAADADPGPQSDGAAPGDPDATPGGPDAAPPVKPACPAIDPTLVACYDFEDEVLPLRDGSSYGNDGATFGLLGAQGPPGHGSAGLWVDATVATVPDAASLDVTALTIDVWVRVDELPPGGQRAGIVDKNDQYSIFVGDNGTPRCTVAGSTVTGDALVVGAWTHVACTYQAGAMRLYQGGDLVDTLSVSNMIETGPDVLGIGQDSPSGDPLNGGLDDLRIWGRAFSATEVCIAADRVICMSM